ARRACRSHRRSVPAGFCNGEGDTRSEFPSESTADRRTPSLMIAVAALLFGLGLVVGSFLNVCIYRLPREESIAWPASRCTTCNRTLRWYENVPVLSWALLRGRCRTCRSRISTRYPIVELTAGVLFLTGYFAFGLTPMLAVRLLFGCAMVVLFAIDLEHQILPNEITLP